MENCDRLWPPLGGAQEPTLYYGVSYVTVRSKLTSGDAYAQVY